MGVRSLYFASRPILATLFSIPLLGYALRLFVAFLKLPRINFHLRRLDREALEDRARASDLAGRHDILVRRHDVLVRQHETLVEQHASLVEQHIVVQANLARLTLELQTHWDRTADIERNLALQTQQGIESVAALQTQQDRIINVERDVALQSQQGNESAAATQTQQYRITAIEIEIARCLNKLDGFSAALPGLIESATSTQTAIRMLRRERIRHPESSATESGFSKHIWFDPQIEVVPERQLRREPPVTWNRMPRFSDWSAGGPLSNRMGELQEPHLIHRKMWEYAICIEALAELGVVTPDAVALAVGAGTERPLYYYANTIKRMVATDLYDNEVHEGTPVMLTSPASFAPFPYREDRLDVMRMGGDALAFNEGSFDFVFCLSSIEHFGSRQTQARAFSEMGRVVRSGGIVCIITELILNGEKHHEYYSPSEIWEMFLQDPVLKLVGPLDMRISDALPPLAVDVRVPSDLTVSPHIVLTDGRVLWTSLSLFFRKA